MMIWTYVIAAKPYDGWAKIGHTTFDPRSRLRSCQTGNPHRLELVAVWPLDAEAMLHHVFSHLRGEGEWFGLSEAAVEAARPTSGHPRGHVLWLAECPPSPATARVPHATSTPTAW